MTINFVESFMIEEEKAKVKQLQTLREEYPGVKFDLVHMYLHGPLMEIDAGFSATYLGDDGNSYSTYVWLPHPQNFMKSREGECVANRQFRRHEYV